MQRTTIMLPPDLKSRAIEEARELGISFGELVRESLESRLQAKCSRQDRDPLFADNTIFKDDGPDDLAAHHDDYLYGDGP